MLTLYLDNCCYNRPFDDRTNVKNYFEREAVLIIMQMVYEKKYIVVGSEVLEKEMSMISNMEKRENIKGLYKELIKRTVVMTSQIVDRAKEIMERSNLKAFDSLYLASAENGADILLTTDEKFLKAACRLETKVRVLNPIAFLMEVIENEHSNEFDKK
jgi:predicted nucleic acid-binding protein